ncbi:MAG: hypothetical protein ABI147_09840 [Acidobacteriaceae bacterium]
MAQTIRADEVYRILIIGFILSFIYADFTGDRKPAIVHIQRWKPAAIERNTVPKPVRLWAIYRVVVLGLKIFSKKCGCPRKKTLIRVFVYRKRDSLAGGRCEMTTHATTSTDVAAKVASDRKPRIAQPPYLQLRGALDIAERIYEQCAGTANSNQLTSILNNSVSSSSFTRKLQALRLYRLTSGMVPPVTLTDVALAIVAPKDEAARSLSLKAAATGPEVFRKTYEKFKSKLLPQDEFLRNSFVHDMQLPPIVADAWVDSFKSALDTAGLLLVRPDGKTQVLEGPSAPSNDIESRLLQEEKIEVAPAPLEHTPLSERILEASEGHTTRITLADGRLATIFIPDRLTPRDAARLKGALAGISAIIESMIDETPNT